LPTRFPLTNPAAGNENAGMAIASLTLSLSGNTEIQLTPEGPTFKSWDGRPGAWRIDREIAKALVAKAAARKTPLVIDYEHQTLLASQNGQPAPAAGWFGNLEWREGKGLFATDVKWTDRAAAMIAAGEYKFISPVFEHDKNGVVKGIRMAALTNYPGLDGMQAVALTAAFARLSTDEETQMAIDVISKLREALGLAETETEEATLAAALALKSRAEKAEAELAELKTKAKADAEAASTELAALKAKTPDPAKSVPLAVVTELQGQFAALRADHEKVLVDQLFKAAREEGKVISPEFEAHLRTIPMVALKGILDGLTPVAALSAMQSSTTQIGTDGKPVPAAHDIAVMKALGLSADEYAKGKLA
jgi:phage I-like protein